jgi:hypothetical protein
MREGATGKKNLLELGGKMFAARKAVFGGRGLRRHTSRAGL